MKEENNQGFTLTNSIDIDKNLMFWNLLILYNENNKN